MERLIATLHNNSMRIKKKKKKKKIKRKEKEEKKSAMRLSHSDRYVLVWDRSKDSRISEER